MKPILFSADETDFTTNGLGRLDCISCNVVEERNGMYELEAEIPVTSPHANEIQKLSIIGAIPYEGSNVQAFVVYKISKPINGRFRVYARHLSYRLSDIPCKPFSIAASPQACAQTLAGLKSNAAEACPFNFITDVTTGNPYVQKTPASIRKRLGGVEGSVIDQFGGEFKWDNFNVSLLKQRGRLANVTGITLRYGKNITDINQEEEIANTATGVFPFWIDTDGNNLVMIPSPDTIIYSPNAENYPYHLTQILDLSSYFQEQPTAAQLKSVAQVYVNKPDFGVPKISIKVSFVDLWKSEEYKNIAPLERVQLCDEITVDFEKLGIKALAKVVKTDYDVLKERYNSIEVGSVRTTLAQAVTDRETSIDTAFIDQFTRINGAIADATAWLTSANGYVVAVKNQDGSWKELLFMNTNDPQTATAGIRINENGIGFFSKTLTPSGDVLSGPYSMAWTMDGRLGDFANKNFWNFLTGEFSLSAGTTVGGKTVQRIADDAQAAAEATAAAALAATAADLQSQIDGNITSWFYSYAPTTSNAPANTWTTLDDKINHIGDLFYDSTTGYCYRWQVKSTAADPTHPTANDFEWVKISDEDISEALALASRAQDTADKKRRIFITQPVPPYDTGDLWCVGSSGDILTCTTAKTTGQTYEATDWSKLNKYVDSTDISDAITDYDTNTLDQSRIYNKLTNNSDDCIILDQYGALGIRASAIITGLLADKYGYNYLDLDTGEMKISSLTKIYGDDTDYSGAYQPTNSNSPAMNWNTEELRRIHVGNTFMDTSMSIPYVYSVSLQNINESTHPTQDYVDEYYVYETGLTSIKLSFNALCELESNVDYLDIYYFDPDTRSYFKKQLTGSFGSETVYIKTGKFWLHFHTDSSVNNWGWKIDSIEVGDGTSSSGFYYESALPSYDWESGIAAKVYEWKEATLDNYIQSATNQLLAENLTSAEIFNLLTNGGKVQGMFMQNGQVYFNAEYIGAGAIRIGGSVYQSKPELIIKDTTDHEIGRWDKDGISAEKGQFGGLKIYESGKLYLGSSYSSGARTTLQNGELNLRSPQIANDRQVTLTDDGFELAPDLQSSTYDYLKASFSDGCSIKRRVSGTAETVRWQSASDERLKEDITDLDIELSQKLIESVKPIRFKYKKKDGIYYGMIAQNVRETLDVLGETESRLEFSQGSMNGLEDQRAINYEEFVPHLINYVKRQQAEIDELKEIVKKLSV